MKYPVKRIMPALLWSAFIFFLCFLPGDRLPEEDWMDLMHVDKVIHVFLYVILMFLLLRIPATISRNIVISAGLLCLAQGVLIEWVQGNLIPLRSFDYWDIAANIAGVITGGFFFRRMHKTS